MAALLETHAGPDPVEPGQEILPPRRHRIALQQRGAADDQANRISRRMTIDAEEAVTHRGRSEEHTSELQSLMRISYAVFCLKKKNNTNTHDITTRSRHTPTPRSNNEHKQP